MLNEFSMETLYENGLGLSNRIKQTSQELYFDGDLDSISLDIASTENYIHFSDMYKKLEEKNADDKIKMLNKLSIRYGRGGSQGAMSIEAYLQEQSIEAEENKIEGGTAGKDVSKFKKFLNWLKTGILKIVEFIKNIFVFIGTKIRNFITFVKNKIKKTDGIANLTSDQQGALNEALKSTNVKVKLEGIVELKTIPFRKFQSYITSSHAPLMKSLIELPEETVKIVDTKKTANTTVTMTTGTANLLVKTMKYFVTFPGMEPINRYTSLIEKAAKVRFNDDVEQKKVLDKFDEILSEFGSKLGVLTGKEQETVIRNLTGAKYNNISSDNRVSDFFTKICGTTNPTQVREVIKENLKISEEVEKEITRINIDFNKAKIKLESLFSIVESRLRETDAFDYSMNVLKIIKNVFVIASKYQKIISTVTLALTSSVHASIDEFDSILSDTLKDMKSNKKTFRNKDGTVTGKDIREEQKFYRETKKDLKKDI